MTDKAKAARTAIQEAKAQIETHRDVLRGERDRLKVEAGMLLKQAQSLTDDIGDTMEYDSVIGMGLEYSNMHGWTSSSDNC